MREFLDVIEEGKRKLLGVVIKNLKERGESRKKVCGRFFFPSSDAKLQLICVEEAKLHPTRSEAF